MKVDWNDVKEDYARKDAEIEELKKEVQRLNECRKVVPCKTDGCTAIDGYKHNEECLSEHHKAIGINSERVKCEFEINLEAAGAKNIEFLFNQPHQNNDEIMFDIGDSYFVISSGRGGGIIKGSYLTAFSGSLADIKAIEIELNGDLSTL